jgi:hypothetical protein
MRVLHKGLALQRFCIMGFLHHEGCWKVMVVHQEVLVMKCLMET